MLQIKVLNVTKRDLVRDFQTAIDFDQSLMFKKVYEEEFGTFGGSPFGAVSYTHLDVYKRQGCASR